MVYHINTSVAFGGSLRATYALLSGKSMRHYLVSVMIYLTTFYTLLILSCMYFILTMYVLGQGKRLFDCNEKVTRMKRRTL